MTSGETNTYIHEQIMGETCHHTVLKVQNGIARCPLCGMSAFKDQPYDMQKFENWRVPDYCSDASPRALLNRAVTKVLDACGRDVYDDALEGVLKPIVLSRHVFTRPLARREQEKAAEQLAEKIVVASINPTAEQIARACVTAHKSTSGKSENAVSAAENTQVTETTT